MLKSILFVCAGNTCRSPMAMVLGKHFLKHNIQVDCAGIAVTENDVVNPHAIRAMKESYGIDLTKYKPKSIRSLHLEDYDYVIALDSSIYARLKKLADFEQGNRYIIWDIPDPYEQGINAYKETLQKLSTKISWLNSKLIDEEKTR